MKETTTVLGIIDAQRGFMPAEEGERIDSAGFGQLPVTDGQRIVPVVKRLLFAMGAENTFTTQDWHPEQTAHFSENPDFSTNWPVHCVQGTQGAELHPQLESAFGPRVTRFYKGDECLEDGKDDLSYSGYYGNTDDQLSLPEWLVERKAKAVILGGLALDYCVGKTALDLRTKMNLEVTVALDATRGIADDSVAAMLRQLDEAGVKVMTSDEILERIRRTA